MKTAFFIRHAKSSWEHPELRDIERPLNPRGLRDAPFMAKLLKAKSPPPDTLLSSPAVRALTTAEFFARELGRGRESITVVNDIYGADPGTLLLLLRNLPEAYSTAWVFGHNPEFTELANRFSKEFIANVPTCGIFRLDGRVEHWRDFSPDTAELTEFHYPKQYFKG
ncbi:MAG: hypothetical protein D6765_02290 [Bacteroidetes bacterium]|nr:MAG: hypothetical protein D6765_02290 [Bacteroidota bacterium]